MKILAPLLLLATCCPTLTNSKAILGVDLGSLYMKVALVQRGAPLEIVTNLHSKRKTENMILFDSATRFYGADANSLYGRKPQKTPSSFSVLLGRDEEHPSVTVLAERHYPIAAKYNETRSGVSMVVDGVSFTPEELVAMLLDHARDMTVAYAEGNGKGTITPKDLVLTVPSYSTQHERKALIDAATLADFNVLALIDETTAAALQFGMDKIMEEPKVYIFYNLGASSLQVNVVRYLAYEHKEGKYGKAKTVGGIEVLGKAWDATLGGLALDHRIVEFLADEFNKKWGTGGDVRDFARPMAKLRVQANKIKHVLSANTEIPIYIEALHADIALQTTVSRPKLEELCADLLERAVAPIEKALKRANITLAEVDGIEMIGGGMRVPKIQEYVQEFLGKELELGMHINSDESMALGASFHGANISTAFKVRHVGLADMTPFPVKIGLNELVESTADGDEEEVWSKKATMFKAGCKTGVKKTIAFSHDQDVHCQVDYDDSIDYLPAGTQLELERYNITGIAEFAAEMKEKELGMPKVSLQFELSTSGITRLVKAEAAVEETYMVMEDEEVEDEDAEEEEEEEAAEEEKKEETKEEETKDEEKKEGDDEEKKDEETKDEETKDEKATDEDKNATEEEKKPKKKKKKTKTIQVEKEKKKVHKKSLTVASYHVGRVQPYSEELMAESKAKMQEMARKDKERQMLETSRNNVESFIYKIKNKLVDDEENINKVSTKKQREELLKLATDAEDWLYDDGYNADLATMEDKYASLTTPANALFFRVAERTARPEAVKALEAKFEKIEGLMKKWETTHPHITEEERTEVLEKTAEVKTWLADQVKAQKKTKDHEDPVFTSEELPGKTKAIEIMVNRLSKKPKPKPPKKNETESSNETKTEGGDDDTETINLTEDDAPEEGEEAKDEAKDEAEETKEEEATKDAKETESPDISGDDDEKKKDDDAKVGDEL